MSQAGDNSVEDILESIKKVIARDNRALSAEQRRGRETRGINLAAPAGGADDVLDLADAQQFLDPVAAEPASAPEPLVTDGSRAAMRESLAALAMLAEPRAAPQIVRSGETSLEGMVRDMLRPALSEWLDRNLPPMVERLVAAEIARIVGKRG